MTTTARLTWRIAQTVASRRFSRLRRKLRGLPVDEEHVIAALLVVELSARPTPFRAAEWLAVGVGRLVGVPRRWLPRTVGPLQITDGPFLFQKAVLVARQLLRGHTDDLSSAARLWNGKHANILRTGSTASYLAVLLVAHDLVSAEPDRPMAPTSR